MAQHDYNIGSGDSKTGLQVRQDINNALAAIKSSNSGAIAPTSPVVGMVWHNSLTNVSYKYTSTGWKAIADEDSVDDIVAPYTVASASSASASAASAASALAASQLATSSANFKGTWGSGTAYLLGESVLYNGIYYRAVANSTNQTPLNNTSYWAVAIPINLGNFMRSKAAFNGAANEVKFNRAGSGFDEFGKHAISSTNSAINEGLQVVSNIPSSIFMGVNTDTIGTSKTVHPYTSINGIISKLQSIGQATYGQILLPTAPTVLPSTATLTQQQIDSGVIKHADASNSGLIINGKFDTDMGTSGWIADMSTLSVDNYRLKVTNTSTNGSAYNTFTTIIGKKYIVEANNSAGTTVAMLTVRDGSGLGGTELSYSTNSGYTSIAFTAISTVSTIRVVAFGGVGQYAFFDNIAVFPADAISRSDLVFLESWHEDVSEKDFVYPLGNVQYLGTTGDCGTTVAGAFAGSVTYSLFSDTWQADSALVGKGYVWSTLSDANKKAFVANHENNCYLDGDKVIQVRYRARVIMGWGDNWNIIDPQNTGLAMRFGAASNGGDYPKPKGKMVSVPYDINNYTLLGVEEIYATTTTVKTNGSGIFTASNVAGSLPSTTLAYEGKCFALPIALVHRRNQGAYHPVYNANGARAWTKANVIGNVPWYNSNIIATSLAQAMTLEDGVSSTGYGAASGYIGTTTGRADGIFYDQVHEGDITDLRVNSRGMNDYQRTSDKWMSKLQDGTYRGTEGEWSLVITDTPSNINNQLLWTPGIGLNIYSTSFPALYAKAKVGDIVTLRDITDNTLSKWVVAVIPPTVTGYIRVQPIGADNTYAQIVSAWLKNTHTIECHLSSQSTRTKSNTLTYCDILGNPASYPTTWKESGVSGVPLIVAEDGTSLLPTGTTGSDGLAVFKLSRKANEIREVIKSSDNGITWGTIPYSSGWLFNTATNAITFIAGNIPLTTDLIRVTYLTHTNMAVAAVNSEVLAIGDVYGTTYYNTPYGSILTNTLVGKVATGVSINRYNVSASINDKQITSNGFLYTGHGVAISHNNLDMAKETTPAVKVFPYLTRSNGKVYLQLVFKEMKYGSYAAPTVVTAASATYTINMTYKINIAGCALDGKVIQWTAATTTVAVDWSLYDVSPTGVIYLLSSGAVYANARLYDGDSWGDDSKFNIVDNVSTTTDTNGATVLIGQKRVELPYFISAAE